MEDLHEELQAQVVDHNVTDGDQQIAHDLGSSPQGGASEADMPCHPETRQEGDGELEDKSGDMRRESNESQVEDPPTEDEVVKHIVEHPFQGQVQSTAAAIAEQFQRHDLPEGRIEEVDDLDQQAFYTVFYATNGSFHTQIN